jgi:hypothetical protein
MMFPRKDPVEAPGFPVWVRVVAVLLVVALLGFFGVSALF